MKRSISQGVILTALLFMVFCGLYVSRPASAADNSDVEEFVTRFYELCLSRGPDSAGLDGWVSALINGTKTGSDVAYGFVFSQEFINKNTTAEEYLQVLYKAFFNRQPDPAGLQGWFDALAGGSSREDVLNGFIYATEFAELCEEYAIKAFKGHITKAQREAIKAFVTRFYQLCLDRDPDAAGLEGWANNLLNQVQTGADVAGGFIYSQEFINKNTTNDEYLTILYKAFFNRDPDQAGWDGWLSEFNAGKNRDEVLDGFIYSAEFSNLSCEYGINAFSGSMPCGEGGGGTNVAASKTIGPEGGTVEISNTDSPIYGAKIIIPPGALSDMKTISIAKSDKVTNLSVTLRSAGEYVDFGPDGTVFNKPVTISLPYNDKNNDGTVDNSNISETDIKVLSLNETDWEWEELTITEIDETLNVISAETTHFSTKTTVIDEENQTNKKKVIAFFEQLPNTGRVLSGQFIGYAYQAESGLTTYIEDVTKPLPVAMIGTDFGWSNDLSSWESDKPHKNRDAIINYWEAGGLITISWHAENPWDGRVSFNHADNSDREIGSDENSHADDKGWEKDSGGNETNFNLKDKFKKLVMALNGDDSDDAAKIAAAIWESQLAKITVALQVLKKKNVIVLWRPFHEMNGRWFWWGQQDRNDFSLLWQHMYQFFEKEGLDNLVWVYSPNVDASPYPDINLDRKEDRNLDEEEFNEMNPFPSEYYANSSINFDIIGLDKYGYPDNTINGYKYLLEFIRPIGLAEFGPCDSGGSIESCGYNYNNFLTLLNKHPKISFFHAWNDQWSLFKNENSMDFLSNIKIVTRHDLDLDLDNCPNAPTNLTATAVSSSQINLSWTASTVYVGITGYRVYRDGVEIGTSTSTSYNVTGLIASTEYCFTVSAYDAAGNESGQSSQICATTTGSMTDQIAPSIPTIINVWPYGSGNLGIKWEGSTDDFGVSGYNIYRDGLKIGTSDMTSYSDSGLKDSTEYCYTVSAFDAAGNESGQSSQVCDTTNTPVITWYKDADGDGYPADETPIYAVVRPGNDYFEESELISIIEIDTDDTDATIYPGADDINDYAQDIEKSYNLGDADLIMERISINVLNDGQDYNCEKQIYQWNFSNLEYEDYNYQVNSVAYEELDGKNIAHINRTETFTINGVNFDRTADIALIFEDNKWKLYGNQLGHQNPEILVAATAEGHNKYEPINPKTNFNRFDSAVYIVAQLDHLKAGSTITCHWFAPNGTQMSVNSWDVDVDPGGYPNCANLNKDIATWWPIEGDEDWWSNYVGTWHADLKVDGVNLKRLEFTYQDNGGSGINPTIIAPIDGESNYIEQVLQGRVYASCEVELWMGEYGNSLSKISSYIINRAEGEGFHTPTTLIKSYKKYTWQIRVRPIGSNSGWEIVSATFETGDVVPFFP